jgi:hypothetical protein
MRVEATNVKEVGKSGMRKGWRKMWKLLDRKEKIIDGFNHFFERWVETDSNSGMVFHSDISNGKIVFVVEGYGIGTIDHKTFKETVAGTCIDRNEFVDEVEARIYLENMQGVILSEIFECNNIAG